MRKKEAEDYDYDLNDQISIFKEKTGQDYVTVYKKYFPKLIYYNSLYLKDKSASEDIAMDSILKSLKKIEDYNPEKAGYSTWLFTISKNNCIQYLNKSNKTISVDKFVDDEGTTIKDFLEDKEEENFQNHELENLNIQKGKILKEKIECLTDQYKKVIKLREIEGKSYREITIDLRKTEVITINEDFFDTENIISLVDPEKKSNKDELVKFYTISSVEDMEGNSVNFEIVSRDKDYLISCIKLPSGNYTIHGEVPFNMSTLKSQIRNGRIILQGLVEREFEELNHMYLY